MITRRMLRNEEWKNLSPSAKLFYIYLKGKFNGYNNGEIRLYYSELEGIKGLSSHATISKASKELENKGWILKTKVGGLYRNCNEFKLIGKFDDSLP